MPCIFLSIRIPCQMPFPPARVANGEYCWHFFSVCSVNVSNRHIVCRYVALTLWYSSSITQSCLASLEHLNVSFWFLSSVSLVSSLGPSLLFLLLGSSYSVLLTRFLSLNSLFKFSLQILSSSSLSSFSLLQLNQTNSCRSAGLLQRIESFLSLRCLFVSRCV